MNLEQIRVKVDEIDDEILSLILKRMECSRLIAKIKLDENMPIYDKMREHEIFENIRLKSADNYKYVLPIFLEILNSSKALQKDIRVYSHRNANPR